MPDSAEPTTQAPLEVLRLWPVTGAGAEQWFPRPTPDGRETDMVRNVDEPSLTVFRPTLGTAANGLGVIVCPGGGWRLLAWEHEGVDVARWLAARGFTALVLKYRLLETPRAPEDFAEAMSAMMKRVTQAQLDGPAQPGPDRLLADPDVARGRALAAEDGRRALALAREHAVDLGIAPDRIGVIGFSAGAYLATDLALEPGGPPLSFVAPIYGGAIADRPVPPDAPPMFVAVAGDDRTFVGRCRRLTEAWASAGAPVDFHVFARGGHGFGLAPQGLPVDGWIDLLGAWLDDLSAPERGAS